MLIDEDTVYASMGSTVGDVLTLVKPATGRSFVLSRAMTKDHASTYIRVRMKPPPRCV